MIDMIKISVIYENSASNWVNNLLKDGMEWCGISGLSRSEQFGDSPQTTTNMRTCVARYNLAHDAFGIMGDKLKVFWNPSNS